MTSNNIYGSFHGNINSTEPIIEVKETVESEDDFSQPEANNLKHLQPNMRTMSGVLIKGPATPKGRNQGTNEGYSVSHFLHRDRYTQSLTNKHRWDSSLRSSPDGKPGSRQWSSGQPGSPKTYKEIVFTEPPSDHQLSILRSQYLYQIGQASQAQGFEYTRIAPQTDDFDDIAGEKPELDLNQFPDGQFKAFGYWTPKRTKKFVFNSYLEEKSHVQRWKEQQQDLNIIKQSSSDNPFSQAEPNEGDKRWCYTSQKGFSENIIYKEVLEAKGTRLMENLQLKVIEQLDDLQKVKELDSRLQEMIDDCIVEMGMRRNGPDFIAFKEFADNMCYLPTSKAAQILGRVKNALLQFQKLGNKELMIKKLNINFDDHIGQDGKKMPITSQLYLQILAKTLAYIRFLFYKQLKMKHANLDKMQDDIYSTQYLMTLSQVEEEVQQDVKLPGTAAPNNNWKQELKRLGLIHINCNNILCDVLDLYSINYQVVDGDADLILRKMRYLFEQMQPLTVQRKRVQFEVNCLYKANGKFIEYLRDPFNNYPEMDVNPILEINSRLGLPPEYSMLLMEIRRAHAKEQDQRPQSTQQSLNKQDTSLLNQDDVSSLMKKDSSSLKPEQDKKDVPILKQDEDSFDRLQIIEQTPRLDQSPDPKDKEEATLDQSFISEEQTHRTANVINFPRLTMQQKMGLREVFKKKNDEGPKQQENNNLNFDNKHVKFQSKPSTETEQNQANFLSSRQSNLSTLSDWVHVNMNEGRQMKPLPRGQNYTQFDNNPMFNAFQVNVKKYDQFRNQSLPGWCQAPCCSSNVCTCGQRC